MRASVFRVSVYQTPRVPGPEPDLDFLSESVDWAANELETASDCRVNRGEFQQETSGGRRCHSAATSPTR